MWYVVHEYETFTDNDPAHSWLIVAEYDNKREADSHALKLNFDDFCLNKITRWPKKYHRKSVDSLDTSDLQQIVLYVLQNVNAKTGSKNQYWGRGYYIISDDRLKIRKGVKKINDIHALLKNTEGHDGGTTHDNPSDSEYFEESEYESGTDSEEETNKEEESDHHDSDTESTKPDESNNASEKEGDVHTEDEGDNISDNASEKASYNGSDNDESDLGEYLSD